jgi:hypothetical protein
MSSGRDAQEQIIILGTSDEYIRRDAQKQIIILGTSDEYIRLHVKYYSYLSNFNNN